MKQDRVPLTVLLLLAAVARGDLTRRAPVSQPYELAKLATSVNTMTDRLVGAAEAMQLSRRTVRSYCSQRISSICPVTRGIKAVPSSAAGSMNSLLKRRR